MPRGLQELVLRIQDAQAKLGSTTSPSLTIADIAKYLNIDEAHVIEGLEALGAQRADSMDQPINAGDDEPMATVHDIVGPIEDGYALVDASAAPRSAVKQLRRSDREVLACAFAAT